MYSSSVTFACFNVEKKADFEGNSTVERISSILVKNLDKIFTFDVLRMSSYPCGKIPLDSGTFHCFKNFESGHGTVYCKTSLKPRIKLSSSSNCRKMKLLSFIIHSDNSIRFVDDHFIIPGNKHCISKRPKFGDNLVPEFISIWYHTRVISEAAHLYYVF